MAGTVIVTIGTTGTVLQDSSKQVSVYRMATTREALSVCKNHFVAAASIEGLESFLTHYFIYGGVVLADKFGIPRNLEFTNFKLNSKNGNLKNAWTQQDICTHTYTPIRRGHEVERMEAIGRVCVCGGGECGGRNDINTALMYKSLKK